MALDRQLIVVADDYGIGPGTSRAILELGQRGIVTGSVLMVNSPYAAEAVQDWEKAGRPFDLGWHPCLTMDRPMADPKKVGSLVDQNGFLAPLGQFLKKIHLGLIREDHAEAELRAQLKGYRDLVGDWPLLINSHQHASLFGPVRRAFMRVIADFPFKPYVRRVREPWMSLWQLPGGRLKRWYLGTVGRIQGKLLDEKGYPGAPWMIGLTDPVCLEDDSFFSRWLDEARGDQVELMCHPGHTDPTLVGRDSPPNDLRLFRRLAEYRLLSDGAFELSCQKNHFVRVRPQSLVEKATPQGGTLRAA